MPASERETLVNFLRKNVPKDILNEQELKLIVYPLINISVLMKKLHEFDLIEKLENEIFDDLENTIKNEKFVEVFDSIKTALQFWSLEHLFPSIKHFNVVFDLMRYINSISHGLVRQLYEPSIWAIVFESFEKFDYKTSLTLLRCINSFFIYASGILFVENNLLSIFKLVRSSRSKFLHANIIDSIEAFFTNFLIVLLPKINSSAMLLEKFSHTFVIKISF